MSARSGTIALVALLLIHQTSWAQSKAPADPLDGPPYVSAAAWSVADGKNGQLMSGYNTDKARPMASTSKIMTAWVVLQLAKKEPKVLEEVVTFTERAAKTTGSSAKLAAGEQVTVDNLLYGLLLPSGNDASVAFAEHFGDRLEGDEGADSYSRFVAELNRQARAMELAETAYEDPHGLSSRNVSSARNLSRLASIAMKDERFRKYVGTRSHTCEVVKPDGEKRQVTWTNTNRLLGTDGYSGVKTGTTTAAGNCLVAFGSRGEDQVIVVVLGSTSADGRYVDSRNLFRWAWLERGHRPSKADD